MSGRLLGGVIAGGGGAVTLGLANKRGRERNATDKSTEYTLGGAYYNFIGEKSMEGTIAENTINKLAEKNEWVPTFAATIHREC